jgi:hypothetical protein
LVLAGASNGNTTSSNSTNAATTNRSPIYCTAGSRNTHRGGTTTALHYIAPTRSPAGCCNLIGWWHSVSSWCR